MTLQDENKELKEKIKQYEELLEELTQGARTSGTIISKVVKGDVRVALDNGEEFILKVSPNISTYNLKKGSRVICNQVIVEQILLEDLEKTPEKTKFSPIEWDQIGGIKSQVTRIREAIEAPILYGSKYKEFGLSPCKGILLYGPAGCGKTLVAKAIASHFLKGKKVTPDCFIYMKGGEMLSSYVGMAENNIKSAFVRARRNYHKTGNRSIIFIDEAEAILPRRGSRVSSDVDRTIVPTFLSEMDGFEENGTLVILATNYPQQIDEAILRPGRIDLQIEISRPTEEDSTDIFKLYLNKTKCEDANTMSSLASAALFESKLKEKVSGALIKSVVERASLHAVRRAVIRKERNSVVTFEDILSAIEEI